METLQTIAFLISAILMLTVTACGKPPGRPETARDAPPRESTPPNRALTGNPNQESAPMSKATCEFGVEGSAPRDPASLDAFLQAVHDLGAQFIVCQFGPPRNAPGSSHRWEATEEGFGDLAAACRKAHLTFFANQEITNYTKEGDVLDEQGHDLLAHPDGTHRWDITGQTLAIAAKHPEFRGVLYDEAEHGQMRRENNTNGGSDSQATGKVHPYFAATDGMTLDQAYDAVYTSASAVAQNYRRAGVTPMTEHVFPVMFHTFARAGFDPATKFMKEGIDPVFAAIAMGAAREYGREFCVTPDLWGLSGFPGHPPEELRASLIYAYSIGATRIFVENIRGLIEPKQENGTIRYTLTPYGMVYQWFVTQYVPAHPRPYTFRDLRPGVAILRFDDSCWGQGDSAFPNALYGAANLKTTPTTNAWFAIFNILTHGHTRPGGLSWWNGSYDGFPHDFFCPLKGLVVYDHLAGPKELQGLKLVFLTGVEISPQTMMAVRDFVRSGGLCITLDSLAPAELAGRTGEVPDGSGKWLVVNNFRDEQVRRAVAPFLGSPDEISYRVGQRELVVKRGKDNNTIDVEYRQSAPSSHETQPNPPPSASPDSVPASPAAPPGTADGLANAGPRASDQPPATAPPKTYPLWDGKESQAAYARRAGIQHDELVLDLGAGVPLRAMLIPAGTFTMGSPTDEPHRVANEGPQHRVSITRPFYMATYEVTQQQYQAVMGQNPSWFKDKSRPVDSVSWDQANEFCRRLSRKTGRTITLPTEAQWEYACRAGTSTRYAFGDDETQLPAYARYDQTFQAGTAPVGGGKPNPWGLFDMHGNVWEWCQDFFANRFPTEAQVDPSGPVSGDQHVLRGGAWDCSFRYCRSAIRYWGAASRESIVVGFRVAIVVQ